MSKVITAIALAAATWAVQRYVFRTGVPGKPRRQHIEAWENEGGALAPQHAPVETSQVPR